MKVKEWRLKSEGSEGGRDGTEKGVVECVGG